MQNVCRLILKSIREKKHQYICVTSAHGFTLSQQNSGLRSIYRKAYLIVPDGMPLVWIGRFLGHKQTSRIYGPDLFLSLCSLCEKQSLTIYLYGTTDATLLKLKTSLLKRYPRLKIVGMFAPPFRNQTHNEKKKVRSDINRVNPNIVFIGLSTPKQEYWMSENHNALNANMLIGVGAAFDFIAGTVPQAPPWVREAGLEWSFRLLQEPKRLWKRYLIGNTKFIAILIKEMTKTAFGN